MPLAERDNDPDPLMNKLAAWSTLAPLWFSATFASVVGSAVTVSSRIIRASLDSGDVTSEVAKAALWLSWS